jgi:hypothetical protein
VIAGFYCKGTENVASSLKLLTKIKFSDQKSDVIARPVCAYNAVFVPIGTYTTGNASTWEKFYDQIKNLCGRRYRMGRGSAISRNIHCP